MSDEMIFSFLIVYTNIKQQSSHDIFIADVHGAQFELKIWFTIMEHMVYFFRSYALP